MQTFVMLKINSFHFLLCMSLKMFGFLCVSLLLIGKSIALDNGLARTPPMGWLTWERFRCNIDCINFPDTCIGEKLIMNTADQMANEGWLQLGYKYIIIDDCWASKQRTPEGAIVPDPIRFPNGIKALADYVHSKGLKFGIYADFGTATCGGYPGSEFYMEMDANTFASWGVDYVKLDGCNSDPNQDKDGYSAFGFYLNKTGRPMVYSCSWPAYQIPNIPVDYETMIKVCNLWRLYDDIQDSWDSVLSIINWYGKNSYNFSSWGGPGHWNDPDMLIIGNFGLSLEQQRTQMAMWAIFAAPLIMSVDLVNIAPESKAILGNKNLIGINQDPLGIQGVKIMDQNNIQIWTRQLSNNTQTVAVLNTNTDGTPRKVTFKISDVISSTFKVFNIYEAFSNSKIGVFNITDIVNVEVNPTGVMMYVGIPIGN